jgi:hypothetical protein
MESSNQGMKDGTNPRQQILEKETIKKTTARTKIRILVETLERKYIKRKLPSYRNIKKSTRRRNNKILIRIIYISIHNIFANSYNC